MSQEGSCAECATRQTEVKQLFAHCCTPEERYQVLIALGRALPPFDSCHRVPANEVTGCQSLTYLYSWLDDEGRVFFAASSEALISAGLAALLIRVYSGLLATSILTCRAHYLEELQLNSSLSPNRASGLYNIHLKMRQDALKLLVEQQRLRS